MSNSPPKNVALTTALAFHYQMLIGLDKCFSLEEGQSVWFEKDGDVSITSPDTSASIQTEVKNYKAPLTDHHENLWKTLKNWLAPEFKHQHYGILVLHTTQAFGATTQLKDWNEKTAQQRLQTLKDIFIARPEKERNSKKPKEIITLQKYVIGKASENLLDILEKVVLHTESADLDTLKKSYFNKLSGYIPPSNRQAFAESLIGFIYEQANDIEWVIDKTAFDQKREALTAKWGPTLFTIPDFDARDATDNEVDTYITELFARKIIEIKYEDVLPDAVGSWLELRNAVIEELNGYPQFRGVVNQYRERWIKTFSAKYRSSCRKKGCPVDISQDLYDQVISETPFGIEGYPNPDLVFRNGLIHDAMDDDKLDLKWRVKP
ncbi:adenylate cyclase [Psychrosphaera sp. F3M07]|uniref:adenylate cyclase n=1 Tax=Psychrosphaera sp. F3M07 TaxID=2841560 RepID=UPI001C0997C6|nr:adenylate cyclase [Psychrosphaera sp. F3M07]MBU2918092.1 adenylate cyclase [Psychrosphaera sp. F3M07]